MATQTISRSSAELVQPVVITARRPLASERFYRPELDLLRFFAFLSVFFHHALPGVEPSHHAGRTLYFLEILKTVQQACAFGVCLFFLLSAFLITELLQRERTTYSAIDVRSFYLRRILRIWPLYFIFLLGGLLVGIVVPDYRIEPGRMVALLLLSGNWYVIFAGCASSPVAPLWSISVEEQFYLVWPWISKFCDRKNLLRLCFVLIALSWGASWWLCGRAGTNLDAWVNSFVQFQFFAIGALLALAFRRRVPVIRTSVRVVICASGLFLWFLAEALFRIKDDSLRPSLLSSIAGYALVAAACVLLFLGFLGLSRKFVPKALSYLGKISYGLYVFHLAALHAAWKLARLSGQGVNSYASTLGVIRLIYVEALALGVTIALALVSYKFLEQPFLKLKQRFALIESRAI